MLTIVALVFCFVIGVIVGAYSHKWLAQVALRHGVDTTAAAVAANKAASDAQASFKL
jgi:hypothetical protein